MRVEFKVVGKTQQQYLLEGIAVYEKRLRHYLNFEIKDLPDVKLSGQNEQILKEKEGEVILKSLETHDYLILLDERGKQVTSVEFSGMINKLMVAGTKNVVFLVGGAYGFSEAVYKRANATLSLSKMTFPHQLIRLFFVEQLYRAMTILRNESYNH